MFKDHSSNDFFFNFKELKNMYKILRGKLANGGEQSVTGREFSTGLSVSTRTKQVEGLLQSRGSMAPLWGWGGSG